VTGFNYPSTRAVDGRAFPLAEASGNARPSTRSVTRQLGSLTRAVNSGSGNRASSRGSSGDGGVEVVGNLTDFEHKRTLFNMDNTIFSLTSGAHATVGGSNGSRG